MTRTIAARDRAPCAPNLVALLYLASGVLFILALRGLSSPATSRQGNYFGMLGMTIAMAHDARDRIAAASHHLVPDRRRPWASAG